MRKIIILRSNKVLLFFLSLAKIKQNIANIPYLLRQMV